MNSAGHIERQEQARTVYVIWVQIFLTICLLFYCFLVYFSFSPHPNGSPLADHPYTPWDFEMITVKLLFLIFIAGYYFSWKSRLISGLLFAAWCIALVWQAVYIGKLLHVAGDSILFALPILPVAVFLIITGIRKRKAAHFTPRLGCLFCLVSLALNGCVLMPGHGFSESTKDKTAGENLGFEKVAHGVPVNWYFKTQRVINNMSKSGDVVDFDMIVDSTDAKEGSRSIRYTIRKCNSGPEHMTRYAYYPGFFQEFDGDPGSTYRVSFWIKNAGCEFEVLTSAVREMGGPKCEGHRLSSKENIDRWQQFSMDQTICPGMKFLRIEVNLKSQGVFQIDGFSIEKVS
jgi:hypothetical protein